MPMYVRHQHIAQFKRLSGPTVRRSVSQALFAGGFLIRTEAQINITAGAQSGSGHVPSLPGQALNNDTGILANNIEMVAKGRLLVEVSPNGGYSAPLRFGTSRTAA